MKFSWKQIINRKYFVHFITLFTLFILIVLYFIQYPVKINKSSLEIELQSFEKNNSLIIQKIETIDNRIIALYTYEDTIGYGIFEKGLNNRCLLTSSSKNVGGYNFVLGDIKTNKSMYSIFSGKNFDNKIKSIEFTYEDGSKIKSDVSKDEYFIEKIDTSKKNFSFLKFDLLDENGVSIKRKIFQEYIPSNIVSSTGMKAELILFNFWYIIVILFSSVLIYSSFRKN